MEMLKEKLKKDPEKMKLYQLYADNIIDSEKFDNSNSKLL